MAVPAHDKYYLRSLHDDIALYDRKLAHLNKFETFSTEADRVASAKKLNSKRDLLVRTAALLVSEGIEFKPSELPPSLRFDTNLPEVLGIPIAAETPALREAKVATMPIPSPFAGTALDVQKDVLAYKRSRSKTSARLTPEA